MCMERNGTDILHSLIPVDNSHLSLQFCGFFEESTICAHSWEFLLLASRGQWGTAYEKSQVPTHTAQSPAGVAPLSP